MVMTQRPLVLVARAFMAVAISGVGFGARCFFGGALATWVRRPGAVE